MFDKAKKEAAHDEIEDQPEGAQNLNSKTCFARPCYIKYLNIYLQIVCLSNLAVSCLLEIEIDILPTKTLTFFLSFLIKLKK